MIDLTCLAERHCRLPLVSVIIINYNYGIYLREAIESVFSQNYSEIECIVVDNASTDSSRDVIERAKQDFPTLKLLFEPVNGGQSEATAKGLQNSTGNFIICLDADDFLLPDCIEMHVLAHLSIREPVGLTSGDVIQLLDERVIATTFPALSAFVRSNVGRTDCFVRSVQWQRNTPDAKNGTAFDLEGIVHHRPAPNVEPWCWSPMSGNCFRRKHCFCLQTIRRLVLFGLEPTLTLFAVSPRWREAC